MRQGNHSSAKPSLSQPPQEKWSADDLIFENVLTDLDAIPFHHTLDELQRLAPTCFPFPVHLAVHKFVGSGTPPRMSLSGSPAPWSTGLRLTIKCVT